VNFRRAVLKTPQLANAWRPGLGALRAQDRPHVVAENPRFLKGSADVDSGLQAVEPNAHRWDFAIGYRHTNWQTDFVYWVEIHTANEKEVNVVLDKFQWLKLWLAGGGNLLNQFKRDFIWVSSGATSFNPNSPKLKSLAQQGLQHRGRILHISSQRAK
jgi:hypothetical protein